MSNSLRYAVTGPLRGMQRLLYPAALPYMDRGAVTGYCGSISRIGDNADWDWCLYQDQKGEYVLFEVDGPGCVYNFTQHRYPTSEEPVFRFYVDNGDTPVWELSQSDFWQLPVGGAYEGPEDGGRGPIWVVRQFMPLPFITHCKITSSLELKGFDKAKGEGGWGHVTYTVYDTPQGLAPVGEADAAMLTEAVANVGQDPKYSEENECHIVERLTVPAGGCREVVCRQGQGSVAAVRLWLSGDIVAAPVLSDLRIRMYWDDRAAADVDAPIGTFFGNEYGFTDCDHRLLLLGMKYEQGRRLEGYQYFPMPFWSQAKIELYNKGQRDIVVDKIELQFTPASVTNYRREEAGYFISSAYYEVTDNVPERNSVIATVEGTGLMVYGVLSGYGIERAGCEGDVRVFFDGRRSPEMESDDSESWASYGWGFVTPPQSNPFSAYNGRPASNADWSEVRLTAGDAYFFHRNLRFELEHGCINDGGGAHSGQVFCYRLEGEPRSVLTDCLDMAQEEALRLHGYTADCTSASLRATYANGYRYAFTEGCVHTDFSGAASFVVDILPENSGVLLQRTSSQEKGRQAAAVAIDGVPVKERIWYYADHNPHCCWLDDYFLVPAKYTAGKRRITVTLTPLAADGEVVTWNHAGYAVYSFV